MSSLSRRSPAREAIQGIYFIFMQIIRTCCKIKPKIWWWSLTALPIIETQLGDVSAYTPTMLFL
jgi:F-type H+-transporting ATPase subunit alpha